MTILSVFLNDNGAGIEQGNQGVGSEREAGNRRGWRGRRVQAARLLRSSTVSFSAVGATVFLFARVVFFGLITGAVFALARIVVAGAGRIIAIIILRESRRSTQEPGQASDSNKTQEGPLHVSTIAQRCLGRQERVKSPLGPGLGANA